VPGAAEVLGSLPADRWAVVTSGRRVLAESRLASLPRPEVLICGEDVEHGKPAPDGYLAAARALGADAAECVVLEDAPPGVEAAAAAGMRALAVTTTHGAPELGRALATIPDLSSLAVRVDGPALSVSVH
jgi:mannitol-1-/sugar-/sorbitol-6-phosphatase